MITREDIEHPGRDGEWVNAEYVDELESRLTFEKIQADAVPTRSLPDNDLYAALGLGGEAGELLNIRKKIERDQPTGEKLEQRRIELLAEGGDVLFYLRLALAEQGFTLEEAGEYLLSKLDRMAREQRLSG